MVCSLLHTLLSGVTADGSTVKVEDFKVALEGFSISFAKMGINKSIDRILSDSSDPINKMLPKEGEVTKG